MTIPDLLALTFPSIRVLNMARGSSILDDAPGPALLNEIVQIDHVSDDVTAVMQGGSVPVYALVWSGINDDLHWCFYQWLQNQALTVDEIGIGLAGFMITRLTNYLAALFAAGISKVLVCTEPGNTGLGGPGHPAQDAADRELAVYNLSILALSDPRIIVADLANAPGLVKALDGLHYNDYTPHAAYLTPFVTTLVS